MARAEVSIEDTVVKWAAKQNIPCFKLKLDTNAGWPDRQFLLPRGTSVFIEFKKPGKKARKLQAVRIRTLHKLGYHAAVFDTSEAAIRWLTEIQASPVPETGY